MLLDRLFQPAPSTVPVIHPSFKALGRIWVPWPVLSHTSGLDRVLHNHPHAPSLCVLYQTGKCFSREKCNQIHVERQWASTVWHALEQAAVYNCCRSCGDLPSVTHELFGGPRGPPDLSLRVPGVPPFAIPVQQIAATRFWQRFLAEDRHHLYFAPDRICILHQQNTCKYGVECKNVHLCRKVWKEMLKTLKAIPGITLSEPWDSAPLDDSVQEQYDAPTVPVTTAPPAVDPLRPSRSLAIVHPNSGEEIVPVSGPVPNSRFPTGEPVFLTSRMNAPAVVPPALKPPPPPTVRPARASHALAIVDPESGAELTFSPSTSEPAATGPLSAVNFILDGIDGDHMGVRCASAVLEDDDEDMTPPSAVVRRVPTLEAMSVYDAKDGDGHRRMARRWTSREGDNDHGASEVSLDTSSSVGTPGSPASSVGSDGASTASGAFIAHRSFPKPALKPKGRTRDPVVPSSSAVLRGVEGFDPKAWALKLEASRGTVKKVGPGFLGVVLTAGPAPHGFSLGRGCPI